MTNSEDILNKAIDQLRAGTPVESLISDIPQAERPEIAPLLELASTIFNTPRNRAPRPLRRYKFAEISKWARLWSSASPFVRWSLAPLAAFLVISFSVKVTNARPADTLSFEVKKGFEQLPMLFTQDPAKEASIQLHIANSRLEEATAIINSPDSNSTARAYALSELDSQTKNTVDRVVTAATAKIIAKQDSSSLLAAIGSIADNQAKLAGQVSQEDSSAGAASSALATTQQSKLAVAQLKRLAATVNNQELADLNAIIITGTIANNLKTTITIENNTFIIDQATVIQDENDKVLAASDLPPKAQVTVVGTKNYKNELRAEKITLLLSPDATEDANKDAATPSVKGESVTKPVIPQPKKDPAAETSTTPLQPDNKTNQAVGGAFYEPPTDLTF